MTIRRRFRIALAIAACVTPHEPASARSEAPAVGHAELARQVVESYQRCWNLWNTNWRELPTCYDDPIVSEEPGSGSPAWRGKDAVLGHVELFKRVFPDAKGALQLVLANGNRAVGIALLTGTHEGAMRQPGGEIAPTHKRLGIYLAHALDYGDQGRSVRELIFLDHASLWGQLGLFPGPHRANTETGWPRQLVVVAKNDHHERKNLEAYRRRLEHLNAHDARALAAGLADDVVWSDAALPTDMDKPTAIAFVQSLWRGFSNLKVTAAAPWAAGDYVTAVGLMEGDNEGDVPALKLEKTGRRLSLPFLEIVKFEGGRVAAAWIFYDGLGRAMQLGQVSAKGDSRAGHPSRAAT